MSLLTIIQAAADRIGIPSPTAVISSSEPNVRMMLSLSNQEGVELARRHAWQRITNEHTFATVNGTVAYALPTDFDRLLEGTMYNRTQDRLVVGPITPQRWQQMQANLTVGTWTAVYIRGNYLRLTPTPTAAETIAFEYVSRYWCGLAADTSATALKWANDDDITFLDEELVSLGVVWRFLRARGLDYSEAFRSYEEAVSERKANDGGMRILDLGNQPGTTLSDPSIADGNWSLT
jgi:hypothetical protein